MTRTQLDPLVHLRRFGGSGPWRGDAPGGIGDLYYAHALALRFDHGTLLATFRAWNTLNHVEYEVPVTWDGSTAVGVGGGGLYFRRNLGVMPNLSTGWYGGLFYDAATGRYFSNRCGNYDTDPSVMTCSMVGVESGGKLVNQKRLTFSIGDKRCQYVANVPHWVANDYLGGGEWYALCGGGGMSACATGNVSLMPSLCVFQLPAGDGAQTVECLELQGAIYSAYKNNSRQPTTPMRWQEFGNDCKPPNPSGWPAQPYLTDDEPGYWGWAHLVWAGMTWIDTPAVSGPLFYIAEPCQSASQMTNNQPGCEYYGHNDGSDAPCSGWSGQKACLNTSAKRPVWYTTAWEDIAAVARGTRAPETVKSTRVEFTIPGIVIPATGWPDTDRDGVGASVAYDDTRDAYVYGLMITGGQKTDGTDNAWPLVQFYQVESASVAPLPLPSPPTHVVVY